MSGVYIVRRGSFMPPVPEFSYTGEHVRAQGPDGSVYIAFLSSGTLRFARPPVKKADLFLVSAGGNGKSGHFDSGSSIDYGGAGGDGGRIKTFEGKVFMDGMDYPIVIGQCGPLLNSTGGDTEAFEESSRDGESIPGGGCRQRGADGVFAFGDSEAGPWPGRRFGASGGGSGSYSHQTFTGQPGGFGGVWGAGRGGAGLPTGGVDGGTDALPNSGSGGGAGGVGDAGGWKYGKGGSGILIMRFRR